MPTVQKRAPRQRKVLSFADIGIGERIRWHLGQMSVHGYSTPAHGTLTTWASWAELFETYEACRDAFLLDYHDRRPERTAGIEVLYAAWLNGDDPSTIETPCELPKERDPRELFREYSR